MSHTRSSLAIALALAAVAATPAAAMLPPEAGQARSAGNAPVIRPIVADGAGGFDWKDAGIGFAAAGGLALMGAGSLATVRWRRQTRTLAN